MTALASVHTLYQERFACIAEETLQATVGITGEDEDCVRDRVAEASKGVAAVGQLRAIYQSTLFWKLAAMCPINDLSIRRFGRPRDYPDWLLLLLECIAGIAGISTRHSAIVALSDPDAWAAFVYDVDRFVPEGMTKLADIPRMRPRARRATNPLAVPQTLPTEQLASLVPTATRPRLLPVPDVDPPTTHHSAYFVSQWRGVDKTGRPLPSSHPWHGLRRRIIGRFRELAVSQAQAMGLLERGAEFYFKKPDPRQFIGMDGVVWPLRKVTAKTPSAGEHGVGGNTYTVYGSKFTLFSMRIVGQYLSRVIFDFAHTGKDKNHSVANDEAHAVRLIAPVLKALADGGMHGIVGDGVLRGETVTELHRKHGLIVVNHVHAGRNPDGKSGKRHPGTREEKSHLRSTLTHPGLDGRPCRHPLFLYGGHLVELLVDGEGNDRPNKVEVIKYQRYPNADGTWREYHLVKVTCAAAPGGFLKKRVALFHDSEDDPKFNYGEFARVLAPHTEPFKRIYSTRNDTESRHADLKARIKFFPRDVPGQEMRLLGAAIANNALALHVHLQAHRKPNAIDSTA